jgi:predicted alpha/beta superfamily hydrolase
MRVVRVLVAAAVALSAAAGRSALSAGPRESRQATSRTVATTFQLAVPADTPADAGVFLAGNLLAPPWRPDGARMTRTAAGAYSVTIDLPAGTTLEYKFTRGSWATVEKNAAGGDIGNRRLQVSSSETKQTVTNTVLQWGAPGAAAIRPASSLTGHFKMHADVASTHLANRRNVLVYLPPRYDADPESRYPVLYMHDGQNLFDRATAFGGHEWEMDETAEALIAAGKIQPLIIVGIYNTGARMTEYTPVGATPAAGRNGDDYERFVIEELKPFIDRTYRTRPGREDTAVAGSSLGGLISLEMTMHHPETFGKAGVVSPSLFWNNGQAIQEAADHARQGDLSDERLWIDIGTNEQPLPPGASVIPAVQNARRLVAEFRKAGLSEGVNYTYLEVPGGEHNETWWARRVDRMLMFLFPPTARGRRPLASPS